MHISFTQNKRANTYIFFAQMIKCFPRVFFGYSVFGFCESSPMAQAVIELEIRRPKTAQICKIMLKSKIFISLL